MSPGADKSCTLPDGRRVRYRECGASDGRPVLALHGTPGSRLKFSPAHQAAARRGLRLIAPDRWGYGGTPLPDGPASLTGYARDAAAFMSELGIRRFSVIGISGGGPFAVAVAAELPGRLDRLALVAPVGRVFAAECRLTLFHRICFRLLPRIPGATRLIFSLFRLGLGLAPELAMRIALLRAGAADRRVMADRERRRALAQVFATGLSTGVDGAVMDLELFARPWDIDFTAITAPTMLWTGDQDRNVPSAAIEDLAHSIAGARLSKVAGQGHLWITDGFEPILDWLR